MDPSSQPLELANLTQVEEILIARVSPILQVTHVLGGQYKYKGHTICFPQNIEHVYQSLPRPIKDFPIIIVQKKDQCGTNYDFTINKNWVYCALRYKIENDKFYIDVNVHTHALDEIEKNIDCNIFY